MIKEVIRDITSNEIAAFQRDGWVFLRSLVHPAFIAQLRERAERIAESARNNENYQLHGKDTKVTVQVTVLFSQLPRVSEKDELFRTLVHSPVMARNASQLLRGNPQVRHLVDNVLIKEPRDSSFKHDITDFHQDSPTFPFDRTASLNFWFALEQLAANMGTIQCYTGSQIFGLLGRSLLRPGDSVRNRAPWLQELTLSPACDMNPGDVTVFHGLTVHGTAANLSNRSRWAYSVSYFDADTLYTGAPYYTTDGLGLKVNEPFEHPRFPVVNFIPA